MGLAKTCLLGNCQIQPWNCRNSGALSPVLMYVGRLLRQASGPGELRPLFSTTYPQTHLALPTESIVSLFHAIIGPFRSNLCVEPFKIDSIDINKFPDISH